MESEPKDEHRPSGHPTVPGSSGPGEPGYEGRATIGDEGAVEEGWEESEPMEGEAPTG